MLIRSLRLLRLALDLAWIAAVVNAALPRPAQANEGAGGSYFTDSDRLPTPTHGAAYFRADARSPYAHERPRGTLVDLHAHLFEHGLNFVSGADFGDPALAASWGSRFANKVNAAALEASGLGLVVVALYSHPILSCSARDGIRRQVETARRFVESNPGWVIARDPKEAARAYSRGKKILVFSLEGAGGVLETEEDIREFIDEKGIRIVTFAHLTDDAVSGAALMNGYQVLGNPVGLFKSLFRGSSGRQGERLNPQGMTPLGDRISRALLKRGVWLDLSHASEATHAMLLPLVRRAGQPLLYTHIGLRAHRASERLLSESQLAAMTLAGGVVGLVPAESILGTTPVPAENCPARCGGRCKAGVFSLAAQYNRMARAIGPKGVFVGSDFNGAIDHLKPSAPGCALGSTIDGKGFADISQTGELWQDLREAGALSAANEENGVKHFLEAWAKVKAAAL